MKIEYYSDSAKLFKISENNNILVTPPSIEMAGLISDFMPILSPSSFTLAS